MKQAEQINLWEILVNDIVADYKHLNHACNAAMKAGCLDINGSLFDAIWRTFSRMLERIDVDGWIAWHIYENEIGRAHV